MPIESPLDPATRVALEQAVREGGPPRRYVRVLDADIADDGRVALVLSLLNPDDSPYPMISFCQSFDGVWQELVMTEALGAGANWAADRWVAYVSGEAPEGATTVVLRQETRTRRRPVVGGFYVAAFWFPPGGPDDQAPDAPTVLEFS
jgi:hypothetical protein